MKKTLLGLAFVGLATAPMAYSYMYSPPAKWGPFPIPGPSGDVFWRMNDAGTPDLAGGPASDDGEVLAMKAAMLSWEDSTSGNLDLEYDGGTAAGAVFGDGENVVAWDEAWSGSPGVLGVGGNMVGASGSIIEGDVEMNGLVTWSDPGFIEGILLHEMGHSLGLGHSADSGAVMAPVYSGESSPQPDDIAGMTGIYGSGSGSDGVDG
ncbi:MAG: matrixin family metalloprotease, partial [Planctomycetes bacterium]|nr:matrixin family metalloprotease [Planctomycetota bacterium]